MSGTNVPSHVLADRSNPTAVSPVTGLPNVTVKVIVDPLVGSGWPFAGVMTAVGRTVLIVNDTGPDAGDGLPAGSAAVAVNVRVPSETTTGLVNCQSPFTSARAVPSGFDPARTVTVAPGSALPVKVG